MAGADQLRDRRLPLPAGSPALLTVGVKTSVYMIKQQSLNNISLNYWLTKSLNPNKAPPKKKPDERDEW